MIPFGVCSDLFEVLCSTPRLFFYHVCVLTVGFHCIFHLIHRCAGHSMTDVTRLLENTVEATCIVQRFVLLLVKHRSIPLVSWRRCI
jgi:hypothetical protein